MASANGAGLTALSVIIPARNNAETISLQVAAVAEQLCEKDELIVVDNGSTDATAASAQEAYSRAIIVKAPEKPGAGYARNVGVRRSSNALLLFTDADDLVDAHWVEHMREALREAPFIAGRLDSERLNSEDILSIVGRIPDAAPMFFGLLPYASGSNMAIERSAWNSVGGMSESRRYLAGEDVELAIRLQTIGTQPAYASAAVVHYRLRRNPKDLYRQARSQNLVAPYLLQHMRYGRLGRPPTGFDAKKWAWLLLRAPLLRTSHGRARWMYQAGKRAGLLEGSLRTREWIL